MDRFPQNLKIAEIPFSCGKAIFSYAEKSY
jgi:hypothetical protein